MTFPMHKALDCTCRDPNDSRWPAILRQFFAEFNILVKAGESSSAANIIAEQRIITAFDHQRVIVVSSTAPSRCRRKQQPAYKYRRNNTAVLRYTAERTPYILKYSEGLQRQTSDCNNAYTTRGHEISTCSWQPTLAQHL